MLLLNVHKVIWNGTEGLQDMFDKWKHQLSNALEIITFVLDCQLSLKSFLHSDISFCEQYSTNLLMLRNFCMYVADLTDDFYMKYFVQNKCDEFGF